MSIIIINIVVYHHHDYFITIIICSKPVKPTSIDQPIAMSALSAAHYASMDGHDNKVSIAHTALTVLT